MHPWIFTLAAEQPQPGRATWSSAMWSLTPAGILVQSFVCLMHLGVRALLLPDTPPWAWKGAGRELEGSCKGAARELQGLCLLLCWAGSALSDLEQPLCDGQGFPLISWL